MARWWEGLLKGGKEAGEIGVKIAGKSTADIAKEAAQAAKDAGKTAERVEPSMGKAADTAATPKPDTKPRVNPNSPEYKDFLAKEKTTKEAAEKAAAEKAAAEKTAADAAASKDNSKLLNPWQRLKLFYSGESNLVNSDLSAIARRNGGVVKETDKTAIADMEKVLSKHRARGITPEEARDLAREPGIPQSIKDKVQKYADARDPMLRTWWGHGIERLVSKWDYFTHYPIYTLTKPLVHPIDTAAGVWSKGKKIALAAVGLDVAVNGIGVAVDAYTGNAKNPDHPVHEVFKKTGADAVKLGVGTVELGAKGVSMLPGKWAEKKAKEIAQAAPGVALMGLHFMSDVTTGAGDGIAQGIEDTNTPSKLKQEGKDMGFIGSTVINHAEKAIVKKTTEAVKKTDGEPKVDETGLPTTPTATTPTPGTTGANTKPAEDAKSATEDDLDEEELEKFKGLSGPQKLLFLKDKGKELAKQGGDALSGGEMKKLKDLAETGGFMGLLGGLMGFMSGGTKGAKLMNALGLGALFGMLGDMLGIPHTLNLGGGGNSRSAMRSHNNYMANGQQAYADMGRGTQPNPNASYDDHGRLLVNTARPPQNQPVYNTQNQPATGPVPQGGIDQGNGVTTYPVTSVARQIDPNGTVKADADLHAATTAALPQTQTPVQVAKTNGNATNDPSAETQRTVQVANGAPQYVYGAAQVDDKKPVPLVQVDGHTRIYGETAPTPQQVATNSKRDNVMELTPSLG